VNHIGELVVARNQIVALTGDASAALADATRRLDLATTGLGETAARIRRQPIGSVWSKFPRVARDIAATFGKSVRVETAGDDTELDKTLIESLRDPLVHLVRNAVDHGIEPRVTRRAAGKPVEGVLRLRAFTHGGEVTIEIVDDGAGIDPDRLRAKALAKGILTAHEARRMSDRDAVQLIFRPGFTTAETVTQVSGRGVGMDVVKSNVERIGGRVEVHSRRGDGTTIRITVPLTLAVVGC
jgi:two-component system chemotaxis sensor kinase CheA